MLSYFFPYHLYYYQQQLYLEVNIRSPLQYSGAQSKITNFPSYFYNEFYFYFGSKLFKFTNNTEEQKIKNLNLQKPRRPIRNVFLTLKTMPLAVFRCQVLRLSTGELIFLWNQMDTNNRISVVPFDHIEKRVIQYWDARPDSEKQTTASFSAWKIL